MRPVQFRDSWYDMDHVLAIGPIQETSSLYYGFQVFMAFSQTPIWIIGYTYDLIKDHPSYQTSRGKDYNTNHIAIEVMKDYRDQFITLWKGK